MIVAVVNAVFADAGFTLAHCVLPAWEKLLETFVIFSDGRAVVVGKNEAAAMIFQKVAQFFVMETVVMDGNISHWVNSAKHF